MVASLASVVSRSARCLGGAGGSADHDRRAGRRRELALHRLPERPARERGQHRDQRSGDQREHRRHAQYWPVHTHPAERERQSPSRSHHGNDFAQLYTPQAREYHVLDTIPPGIHILDSGGGREWACAGGMRGR
jgi:hypothetical protein